MMKTKTTSFCRPAARHTMVFISLALCSIYAAATTANDGASPIVTATAASTGSSSSAAQVELVPGIALPQSGMVWALDSAQGEPMLSPVPPHDVYFNKSIASELVRVLGDGTSSIDVSNPHAALQLKDSKPVLLARVFTVTKKDKRMKSFPPESSYQLIRLHPHQDARAAHKLEYIDVGISVCRRTDDRVDATFTRIAGTDWLKVVPSQPLAPGEYALEVRVASQFSYSKAVYDFGVSE
jgi:hypothetical protein